MICYLCASYISKIMPIILIALAKKIRNYSSTFYFKFGKNTSLSHLQVNGKLVYPVYTKKLYESLIHCLTSIKTQPINNQHADATPGNQACLICPCVESCGESAESLPVGPRFHECDNNRQINDFVT